MFVPDRSFHPSLMFVFFTGRLFQPILMLVFVSGRPFRPSLLVPGRPFQTTPMFVFFPVPHSILSGTLVYYGHKKFYNFGSWCQCCKTFYSSQTPRRIKLVCLSLGIFSGLYNICEQSLSLPFSPMVCFFSLVQYLRVNQEPNRV